MIKISIKGLAKFMTASPSAQRRVLHDYKHPKPEGEAQASYYRDARLFIRQNHERNNPEGWLAARAQELSVRAQSKTGPSAVRLRHNARALCEYYEFEFWGWKPLEILPKRALPLTYGNVLISINPDLDVRDAGIEKVVKLEFSSAPLSGSMIRIMSQAIFEGACVAGLDLGSANILIVETPRKLVHRGARMKSRTARDIEAACQTIADIWSSI
jgi:hypothetical protein